MPPHVIRGLTPEAASHICMNQCKGMCCRGPMILTLTPEEVPAFQGRADSLHVPLVINLGPSGGWLRFSDHTGERCPMLEGSTFACRIYKDRPQRCLDFPQTLTPGCAISGG